MKKLLSLLILAIFVLSSELVAQQVPSRIEFANMDLRLTAGAIKDIQADVDALTRSEKYFQKKLERVDMYMPIIERIFKEEGLPEDFKYLVIQESALVSDAISSSNAVGFWQFKEISGLENNLRIDRYVDERMNIVSSSRAAAAYLKDHNKYFDNWAYALIAYQRGRGGAADVIDEDNFGKTKLKITTDTYWYLKKFLAHKVAFENTIGTSQPPYYLKEVDNVQGSNLKTLAKNESVPVELIEEYNKWIKKEKIPEDKNYTVIVPLSNLQKIEKLQNQKKMASHDLPGSIDDQEQQSFPLVENYPSRSDRTIPHKVEINGLDGIYAPAGYTVKRLAEKAEVDEYKFREWNDLKIRDNLKSGKIYYLRRKRNRAKFYYHTVANNETMWDVSQKYGVKLKKLYRKNRMEPKQEPKTGRVLWLRHNRPAEIPVEYREVQENTFETEKHLQEPITLNLEEQKLLKDTDTIGIESSSKAAQVSEDSMAAKPSRQTPDSLANDLQKLASPSMQDSIQEARKVVVIGEITETQEDSILSEEKVKLELADAPIEPEEESDLEKEDIEADDFSDYSIKKGDTFFSISNRFNMKISTLLSVNQLQIRDTLSIGQIIKVTKNNFAENNSPNQEQKPNPLPLTSSAENTKENVTKHLVSSGDTLYAIAKKYNVSLKEIMEWNDKQDYNLKEGELILIKRK